MPVPTTSEPAQMTAGCLAEFGEVWRREDIDALLTFIADDCDVRASVGPDPGSTYRGRAEVRRGFEAVLAYDDAGEGRGGITVIDGRLGAAQWVLVRTADDDRQTEVRGCDVFEFDGDLIKLKDAYRKVLADLPVASGAS